MSYIPPAGDAVDFDFDDALTGDPNFNFFGFDEATVTLGSVELRGVDIR